MSGDGMPAAMDGVAEERGPARVHRPDLTRIAESVRVSFDLLTQEADAQRERADAALLAHPQEPSRGL